MRLAVLSGENGIAHPRDGHIVSLVEKAQQTFDQKQTEKLQEKLIKSQFTLQDFYEQLQQIKKMGRSRR